MPHLSIPDPALTTSPVEEKYKKNKKGDNEDGDDDDDDSSSSDETEDEEGFLATEDLDAQISATLQAIKTKDPRVYDKEVTFYQGGKDGEEGKPKAKKEKPVFLQDYHRENLLAGHVGASDDEDEAPPPKTYAQEQDALQKSIISQMHGAGSGDDSDGESDDLVVKRKEPKQVEATNGVHPSRAKSVKKPELDIEIADRDPETFLSNFMAARAWVPEEGSRWEAFESDEGDGDDDMADAFEDAYNLRFEDPEKSNEVLKSYSRSLAAARSVRREEKSSRQRRRDLEREKKDEEKRVRREEKARLRKLKLEEAEEKLRKVKQAAGAIGKELTDEEWLKFLDDAWDDDKWEEEMSKRFGDEYYAVEAEGSGSEEERDGEGKKEKKKRLKKPTWDDDIDIKDIVPDFDDSVVKPQITLSEEEEDNEAEDEDEDADQDDDTDRPSKKRKTSDHKRARLESKKKSREERAKLEALVDAKLELDNHDLLSKSSSSGGGGFRYRETEPMSFGMTARDILLAPSDADLNQYAGLKKLAHFRHPEKKARDVQRLSKKKRLRQWRREIFGREYERDGPTYGFEKLVEPAEGGGDAGEGGKGLQAEEDKEGNVVGDVGGSRKKRKRSKGKKKVEAAES
jgi:protein KRI1